MSDEGWNFDDLLNSVPVLAPVNPPKTLNFTSWFNKTHRGDNMFQKIDDYVNEYINYLEVEKIRKKEEEEEERRRMMRDGANSLLSNIVKKTEHRILKKGFVGLVKHKEAAEQVSLLNIKKQGTRDKFLAQKLQGEDDWFTTVKVMLLSGIFNYSQSQLNDTRRITIFMRHDVIETLGFNVDAANMGPLIQSMDAPGTFHLHWHGKEAKKGKRLHFPTEPGTVTQDEFVRGYLYINNGCTMVIDSAIDMVSAILDASTNPQINIILCKRGSRTTEETLERWTEDTISSSLVTMLHARFKTAMKMNEENQTLNRHTHGIFDLDVFANAIVNIIKGTTGFKQLSTVRVCLPGGIVKQDNTFSFVPSSRSTGPQRTSYRNTPVEKPIAPIDVPQKFETEFGNDLYCSMFIHYWFNALTPELEILSNQVDLRYIDYETLKTLHPIDWKTIEQDLSGGAALEELFHFDFCQRRDAFNQVIHIVLKQLNKSNVNTKDVASKFSLFDLSDLIPTALDDKRFDGDFLSALKTFSTPKDIDLSKKYIKTKTGRLSNEDHEACLANIYYSLNNDLMSSGDIKMMFILMDRIKDMCGVRDIFQPKDDKFYNEVYHEEKTIVSPDVHLNYILDFQKKMGFSNPEVQRHGTLSSAINEYIYNAEKSRRSGVVWTPTNNPYRAKDGDSPAGMGEKLIRWFPRMGDTRMGIYHGTVNVDMEKLLTPKYDYIDHSLLREQVLLFPLSNPPWLNTLYQKKFYWFLLGVFNIPDHREEYKIESLKKYLNSKIKKTYQFKSDIELTDWLKSGSLESKLFNTGQFLWVRGTRTGILVRQVRDSLFRWYNIMHRIDEVNITSRI